MNNSSKKEVKATKGAPASRSKKIQTTAPTTPTSPRYTTWLKYVAMFIGVVGVIFIMMGTYGTFRALIHQIHAEDVLQSAKKLPPRAPDGSRMPVGQSSDVEKAKPVESKEVREALKDAEKSVGQSVEQAAKPSEPAKPTTKPVAKPTALQSGVLNQSQIFDPKHPKMAIVIDDIGENLADVRALLSLDFPVTFAIWPHASHSKKAAMLIYSEGKEIILHQPMQAMNDKVDAGEGDLHVGMSRAEIRATLQANLALVPHVSGMNNHMGSRFTQDKGILTVCDVLKERGLFALDSFTIASSIFYTEAQKKGLKSTRRDVFLDAVSGEKNVLYELHRAEGIAKKKGVSVAIGHPFATTISGLKAWSKVRDRSIRIVRLSDIVH